MGKGKKEVTDEKSVTPRKAASLLKKLEQVYPNHPLNVEPDEPFQVLVATVLSSRTKDPVTNEAMTRLWKLAKTPKKILSMDVDNLAEILKPVGFYKTKAKHLQNLSSMLIEKFDSKVPNSRDELMEFPGVGRKVANLVLNICFDEPAICVDTHVHRIVNRLGWINTKTPAETELVLMELVPRTSWTILNRVLVNHGQQVCVPISPFCSQCQISSSCSKIGVNSKR